MKPPAACLPVLLSLLLLLSACSLPTPAPASNEPLLATLVVMTMQALTPRASATLSPALPSLPPAASATPEAQTATVSGAVCAPPGVVQGLTAYFENSLTRAVVSLPLSASQTAYEVVLPQGTYFAYAWLNDFSQGGAYTQAVLCGLKTDCSDHALVTFELTPGTAQAGIDLCDWYQGPFDVPYPPGTEPGKVTGSISGVILNYPGGGTPSFTVVAFNQVTTLWYSWQPAPGDTRFVLDNLPPGTYQVVAYDQAGRAGGAAALVEVTAGKVSPVQVTDWNGDYPPKPGN